LAVVLGEDLTFPNWPCPTGECRYGFNFRSEGPDCATKIAGTFRMFRADETTLLAEDAWALDAARVVRPMETAHVEDGPISVRVLLGLGTETGKYSVTFTFDAVRCS
jgi:hypothetical protein